MNTDLSFIEFLFHLESKSDVTFQHAEIVRKVWNTLLTEYGKLPDPIALKTYDNAFQLTWRYPHLTLEIDVNSDGTFYWFARNHQSGYFEDDDVADNPLVSDRLKFWLDEVASAVFPTARTQHSGILKQR